MSGDFWFSPLMSSRRAIFVIGPTAEATVPPRRFFIE